MAAAFPKVAQPTRISRAGLRVFLRPPKRKDEAEFLALRRASREFHEPYEIRPPRGIDRFAPRMFKAFLDQGPGRGRERWLICSVETRAILGAITLGTIRGEPFRSAVVGYWIGAPHARQGYMTEALPLALQRAFDDLDLRRVEADVVPENVASKRLLKTAGFVKEGLAREYVRVGGRWRDHERWALLKSQRPQSRK